MELIKQSTLTAIFAGEYAKTVNKMDIIHISSRMETHTLGKRKMEREMAMAFTDMLMEQHITGSTMKVKERGTESRSMPAMMSMMDSGEKQVKECTHTLKQE